MITTAVKLVGDNIELPTHWALKPKAAKLSLKYNQPKKLMKFLKYRSLDSMLKRENVYELFFAAQEIESKSWQKNLAKYVSNLDQTDFEMRQLKLLALDYAKWFGIDPQNYASYESLTGVAGIWPAQELTSAPLLTLVLMLAESFTPQIHLTPGPQLVKMNMVMWWVDTDHLVAEIDGEHISLNVKDCAFNSWLNIGFQNRLLDQGRKNFWQSLLDRYSNRPPVEAHFENVVGDKIASLQKSIPEPIFEFAEEFDG
jgi:hypothetical protein